MRDSLSKLGAFLVKPVVAIGGSLAIGVVIVAYAFFSTMAAPSGGVAKVTVGTITEEVDVSGVVKAAHSTDLAFQTSGRIASINVQVGAHVFAGQTLLALDGASQAAALAGTKASLEVQKAKLAALLSGTRPEQLAIDETNLTQASQTLSDAIQSAYVVADDAVHVKADQVFTNPRTSSATFSFSVPDATLVNRVQTERIALEPLFSAWQGAISAAQNPSSVAATTATNLASIRTFLDDLAKALAETPVGTSLSAATLSGYQTSVNAARTAVAATLSSVTGAETAEKAAQGALTLAQAGATQNDIAAEQALVDAAQASVLAAEAVLSQTVITAPIAGTITVQSANPGETVSPGVPLVSMIADGKYQATVRVSENDITKIKLGDEADATFQSYPGVVFSGKVTTVDPAATFVNGVSSYGVTLTFNANDPRLSSGLSANVRIITDTREGALLVPTSALITDGADMFVYVQDARGARKVPVTIGIQSADGMTQVVQGLSSGDTVLSYGASASY